MVGADDAEDAEDAEDVDGADDADDACDGNGAGDPTADMAGSEMAVARF
ncbi:hypothetical protein K6W16_14245 [Burkholderia dolosa]|uniref:Uncharacterized protein n=1 Tax=Burkholderia dolosa TaxID=152500 RepID=A0A892ICL4_9BURK|nr:MULTISPECIES: hypothetical protein [Burkholderia]MBR8417619.1 hypothetical protein [Burkholderia dolosa]MBY4658612.1 hypothetical protein [Burkholderia dolosa]MBY4688929.1 hypothetical protein [Burkholderia dolosa]MBY4781671.1 hypothetical protein [Burkholderia dolosa]MBY4788891.1 hypothetical protein [Burkholderia dolosa]